MTSGTKGPRLILFSKKMKYVMHNNKKTGIQGLCKITITNYFLFGFNKGSQGFKKTRQTYMLMIKNENNE